MYDLLGTPAPDKQLKFYETDHTPPRNELIKETLVRPLFGSSQMSQDPSHCLGIKCQHVLRGKAEDIGSHSSYSSYSASSSG
jgi:hypothetical protein